MNKITYLTSKRLNLTALAAITFLTSLSLTVPLLVNHSQTAFFQNLQSSSASIKTIESSIKKDNHNSDLESDSSIAVKQAKYIQDKALKLEYSLATTVALVKELEGFRSSAYVDTDGTVVIGYGMPVIEGKKVKLGTHISQVKAEVALKDELRKIQQQILAASTVELNSNQLVALTSFAFNVGVESLFKSTLFGKLNIGDFVGAANEFPRWNKANMGRRLVPLAGLTKRRLTEKNLFLTGVN